MLFDMNEYTGLLKKYKINVIYSGPMWEDGVKGLSQLVKTHLNSDDLPVNSARAIFSVFIEQVTNMLMYSAQKEQYYTDSNTRSDVSTGMVALGRKDEMYFIQTRNEIKNEHVEFIKNRIDHLNALDKKELRQYHKECMRAKNDNPESKGAGLGLIEIARRATAPIEYTFEPAEEGKTYFSMCVEIAQERGNQ